MLQNKKVTLNEFLAESLVNTLNDADADLQASERYEHRCKKYK